MLVFLTSSYWAAVIDASGKSELVEATGEQRASARCAQGDRPGPVEAPESRAGGAVSRLERVEVADVRDGEVPVEEGDHSLRAGRSFGARGSGQLELVAAGASGKETSAPG